MSDIALDSEFHPNNVPVKKLMTNDEMMYYAYH